MDEITLRVRVIPVLDTADLEQLLAQLKAMVLTSGPVASPKPAREAAPVPEPVPTTPKAHVPVPGKGGRVTRCKTCDQSFRVQGRGPLPKACPPCKKTADSAAKKSARKGHAFDDDRPLSEQ